ncbi:copper-binding protein [Duganella sp. FT80W]|uniref:Copper-binding protein n=1 Tax=Duganella guangzhouensis TaxID=2666084 RepID=A0A6I2KVK6_9BURK|nr:copper-binding protein [Duganella guangzhouensis]MRW88404.1 copper-binding protein [Duganella guangzhouensis]
MKVTTALSIVLALPIAGAAYGQMDAMQDMGHHGMNMPAPAAAAVMTHQAAAMVKAVDPAKGRVTLAHDAIKTLNWPAMTMAFSVKDRSLLDKLVVGKQVQVTLKQEGTDFVVVAVK